MIDFSAIKFLQAELKLDSFIEWLNSQPDNSIVGKRRNAKNCPVYHYLNSLKELKGYEIQLDEVRVRLIRNRDHIHSHYHNLYQPWISHYITLTDLEKGNVTKEQALALALELKEKQNV